MRRVKTDLVLSWIGLLDNPDRADEASSNLVAAGEDAVEPLLKALEGKARRETFERLSDTLIRIGPPAAQRIITAITVERRAVLAPAGAWILGQVGGGDAVDVLISILGYPSDHARWSAAAALGNLEDARSVEPLISALGDKSLLVKAESIAALERFGDDRAEYALRLVSKSLDPVLKASADRAAKMIRRRRRAAPR